LDNLLSGEISKTIESLSQLVENTKKGLVAINLKDEFDLFSKQPSTLL
jgi:hypothetical protein